MLSSGKRIKKIIFDLDETLISSIKAQKLNKFPNSEELKKDAKSIVGYYTFPRPDLQEFLDYIFSNYSVSIWSAGSRDYVLDIVNNFILKPGRCVDFIFFSYHCTISKDITGAIKSIEFLEQYFPSFGYNRQNCVIIDDNPEVRFANKGNCIDAPEFKALSSKKDSFLSNLVKLMEKEATVKEINSKFAKEVTAIDD